MIIEVSWLAYAIIVIIAFLLNGWALINVLKSKRDKEKKAFWAISFLSTFILAATIYLIWFRKKRRKR